MYTITTNIKQKNKIIGLLGGAGPVATLFIYKEIIIRLQRRFGTIQDQDFPEIIIYNLPLQNFTEQGFDSPVPNDKYLKRLAHGIKKLEKAGTTFIAISCNTTHYFYPSLQKITNIPVMNLINETSTATRKQKIKRALILSSRSTRDLKLYSRHLAPLRVKSVFPDNTEQAGLDQLIRNIMAGLRLKKDIDFINKLISKYIINKIDGVIIGCTEISTILDKLKSPVPIVDSGDILVEHLIKYFKEKNHEGIQPAK